LVWYIFVKTYFILQFCTQILKKSVSEHQKLINYHQLFSIFALSYLPANYLIDYSVIKLFLLLTIYWIIVSAQKIMEEFCQCCVCKFVTC